MKPTENARSQLMGKSRKLLASVAIVSLFLIGICAFGFWSIERSFEQFENPPMPQGTPAARVWQTGKPVEQVQFHPSGRAVAVLQEGGVLTLRNMPDGSVQAEILLTDAFSLTPSATQLSGGSVSSTPEAHAPADTSSIGEVTSFQGALAFSADGTLLATAATIHRQTCLDSFFYPESPNACPQGVSGTWETATSLWQVEAQNQEAYTILPIRTLTHTTFPAYYEAPSDIEPVPWSLSFSPDGTTLAVGNSEGSVTLWDTRTSLISGRLHGSPSGFNLYYGIVGMTWSADGGILYTGDYNEVGRKWRMPEGELLFTDSHSDTHYRGHTTYVQKHCYLFSPDGQLEATASWAYEIALWNLSDGQLLRTIGEGEGPAHRSTIHSMAFSPNSRLIASGGGLKPCLDSGCGSDDSSVRIWRVSDGRQLALYSGHTGTVWTLAWSPDGLTLLSGSDDGNIMLWDVSRLR